jgi:uncharacterized protein YjbJ (UPF0337 family)
VAHCDHYDLDPRNRSAATGNCREDSSSKSTLGPTSSQAPSIPGTLHEVNGTIKKGVRELTDNLDVEADARAGENVGDTQNRVGKVEKAVEG